MAATPQRPFLASEIFAMANGATCEGPHSCHWCSAPCRSLWIHDDPVHISSPYQRTTARCPTEPYICAGCWIWRQKSRTIDFLGGGYKDRQCSENWSWWITPVEAKAIRKEDYPILAELLLAPPLRFILILSDGGQLSRLQSALVNYLSFIKADTPLNFTLNNIPHIYTTYEMEELTKNGPEGTEPGVQALHRLGITPPPRIIEEVPTKKKTGRKAEVPFSRPHDRDVLASGLVLA